MQHYQENGDYGVSKMSEEDVSSANSQKSYRRSGQHGWQKQTKGGKTSQHADQNAGWNGYQRINNTPVKMAQHK